MLIRKVTISLSLSNTHTITQSSLIVCVVREQAIKCNILDVSKAFDVNKKSYYFSLSLKHTHTQSSLIVCSKITHIARNRGSGCKRGRGSRNLRKQLIPIFQLKRIIISENCYWLKTLTKCFLKAWISGRILDI